MQALRGFRNEYNCHGGQNMIILTKFPKQWLEAFRKNVNGAFDTNLKLKSFRRYLWFFVMLICLQTSAAQFGILMVVHRPFNHGHIEQVINTKFIRFSKSHLMGILWGASDNIHLIFHELEWDTTLVWKCFFSKT